MSQSNHQQQASHSVNRQFWSYVLPTVGAMIVSGLYQIIDGIFIGRLIGAEGLAGINLVWPLMGGLYGIGMMIGVGSGALSSLARGENNLTQAKRPLGNAFSLMVILGLLSTLVLHFTSEQLLSMQNASGLAVIHATDYLSVLTLGATLTMGSMALPFMIRNDQSPKTATWLIVLGAILNAILNGIFIGYMKWGLQGAALGTLISQAAVTLLGVSYFMSRVANTRLIFKDMIPDWTLSLSTSSVGFSSLMMFLYFSFITAVHNNLFMQLGSSVHVGAFAIVGYIATLYYMFAEGVASGTQPLISYNYGAGEIKRMKQFVYRMLLVTIGSGIVSVLFVNLFADTIINVFNTEDATLFEATKLGLRLHLMTIFLDGLIFSIGVFFQSLGLGKKATFVTVANMLVELPFLLVLPDFIGIHGIWLAVPLSNIVLSLIAGGMLWGEWKKLGQR